MELISIHRNKSNQSTGLKVYGEVLGDSGKTYKFAYFRRPNFRGFLCSCENFILSKFAKGTTCKHIKFVRSQVGRYAATVEPTRKVNGTTAAEITSAVNTLAV